MDGLYVGEIMGKEREEKEEEYGDRCLRRLIAKGRKWHTKIASDDLRLFLGGHTFLFTGKEGGVSYPGWRHY